MSSSNNIPKPPPLPHITYQASRARPSSSSCLVPKEAVEAWDKIFREGIEADTTVQTDDNYHLLAHSSILGAASPVLANLLDQSRDNKGKAYHKFAATPYEVVYTFLRFLYTSCYEEEDMNKFALPLIIMSHFYSVPSLKRVCVEALLDQGYINKENVLDVLQIARSCDATKLSFVCVSMIIKESIPPTEEWEVMRRDDPLLEKELEAAVKAETRKQERRVKLQEKKTYLELYEATEALLHIYREGCVTIGPRDKPLKGSQTVCKFRFCKGVEGGLRHFLGCKSRASCLHCKRVRQLLQLHACICGGDSDCCEVPLCRDLMEKTKDESTWRLLAEKVMTAKNSLGPFSARLFALG